MSTEQTELSKKAPAEDVKRVVGEFTRLTNLSSDYSGQAGQYLRNQSERLGLSPKLFRKLRSMERQDEAKRQAEIRETLHGWISMGYLDQIDAFDDLRADLAKALGVKAEAAASSTEAPATTGRKRGGKGDKALDSLTAH